MRLIRSKIYRAFPELDRFDDGQCTRFVVAANSSWRRVLLRWVLIGIGFVLVAAAAIVVIFLIDEFVRPGPRLGVGAETLGTVGFALACVAGVAAPCLSVLVFRDVLLRLAIRRLIRRCGACPKCRYSLLGMRVGANNVIVCPECGTEVIADPAMGELTTDEMGTAVYKPEVARDDVLAIERRRRRRRKLVKWSAVTVGSALVLLAVAAASWWMFLTAQARRAKAERNTLAAIAKVRDSLRPEGSTGEGSTEEWARFVVLVGLAQDATSNPPADPQYQNDVGRQMYFEYSSLSPTYDDAAEDKRSGAGAAAATRRLTADMLRRAYEAGTPRRLEELLTLRDPVRSMSIPASGTFFDVVFDGLSPARALARFNAARMLAALGDGDKREYVQSLEEIMAAARIVERQGSLIEKLVGIAMRALAYRRVQEDIGRYPDGTWAEEVMAAIQRQSRRVPMSATMEFERAGGLDAVQYYFSDPARIAKAQLGVGGVDPFGWGWGGGSMRSAIGTYAANRDAMNRMYDAIIASADVEPSKRTPPAVGLSGYAVVDMLTPALGRAVQSDDIGEFDRRRCMVVLATEVFLAKHGRAPATVGDLAGLLPDPAMAVDPYSGKPFVMQPNPETGKGARPYLVLTGDGEEPTEPGQPRKSPGKK